MAAIAATYHRDFNSLSFGLPQPLRRLWQGVQRTASSAFSRSTGYSTGEKPGATALLRRLKERITAHNYSMKTDDSTAAGYITSARPNRGKKDNVFNNFLAAAQQFGLFTNTARPSLDFNFKAFAENIQGLRSALPQLSRSLAPFLAPR